MTWKRDSLAKIIENQRDLHVIRNVCTEKTTRNCGSKSDRVGIPSEEVSWRGRSSPAQAVDADSPPFRAGFQVQTSLSLVHPTCYDSSSRRCLPD